MDKKLELITMRKRNLMVAKCVLDSFEAMRFGSFQGGLSNGSSYFIRAVRSLLYLLLMILRQEGHRIANLFIRHSGLDPFCMLIEDEDWIAFDTLVVVFQTMQYFLEFNMLSSMNWLPGFGTFFLQRSAEPWGRCQVSRQFCRFVHVLLEAFVVPEEFDEHGYICTRNTTVYRFNRQLGYYTVVGVEASYKEFEDAISNDAADNSDSRSVKCAAAAKHATAQPIMLLIISTLPAVCLKEPPEEVLPVFISLLRLAIGRAFYVMETSQLPESQSLGSTRSTQAPKDLQPVLSIACRDGAAPMGPILMPLFIVPQLISFYIKHWRAAIPGGYRCALPLICELLYEMIAPFAMCHNKEKDKYVVLRREVEPMTQNRFYVFLFLAYDLLRRYRKKLHEVWNRSKKVETKDTKDEKRPLKQRLPDLPAEQMELNFWRVIDSLWPTTPDINYLNELAGVLTCIGSATISYKSGNLQFFHYADPIRPQSNPNDTRERALDSFYSGYGLDDHVLSAIHMQVSVASSDFLYN